MTKDDADKWHENEPHLIMMRYKAGRSTLAEAAAEIRAYGAECVRRAAEPTTTIPVIQVGEELHLAAIRVRSPTPTKDDMLARAKAYMLSTYGQPLDMDAAARDRWYERLGLLVSFIAEIPEPSGVSGEFAAELADEPGELQRVREGYNKLVNSFPPLCCGGHVTHEPNCKVLAEAKRRVVNR